jgi:hypothetical protein
MKVTPLIKASLFCLCLILAACETTNRVNNETELTPLANNQGYLSLVIDSLDPLKNLEFENIDTDSRFYEGRTPIGTNLITLKVPEGMYCFVGFDVYTFRVDYTTKGFCTYVEAGEMNYMGELTVRDPVTTIASRYPRFLKFLERDFPSLCHELVTPGCKL